MRIFAIAALAATSLAFLNPGSARAATEEQNLVDQARITLDHLRHDKEFGDAKQLLRHARAVLIVPNLVKGGFIFGGEGGNGVMMARTAGGAWTDPAFYTMASASFGLQIGIESAEVIMIIHSEKALHAVEQDEFKFGASAGLAIVTLGSSAQVASSTALDAADVIVWSSSSGAYAGLTLEGSVIKPREEWNDAYYGKPIAARAILNMNEGHNAGAGALRHDLP
jgi:lipid-binding SYLF domain-containing protein